MSWRAKRRKTRSGALRNGIEALESRALLSGQGATELLSVPTDGAADVQTATVIPQTSFLVLNQPETRSLNLSWSTHDDAAIRIKSIDTARIWSPDAIHVEGTFSVGRGQHLRETVGIATSNSVNVKFGWIGANGQPNITIAPYDGPLEFLLLPHGFRQLPGVAVDVVPDRVGVTGSTPGRPGGAMIMSAVTALTQAFASSELMLLHHGIETVSLTTTAVVDARAASMSTQRAVSAPTIAAHAPWSAVSPLSGGADGGFVSVRAESSVDAESLDALLDTEGSEGLTAAELDWLGGAANAESRDKLAPGFGRKDVPSLVAAPDNRTESSDDGMAALTLASADATTRSPVVNAAVGNSAIEIAAATSMFQAFDFGTDAPRIDARSAASQDVAAGFDSLDTLGEAKEPSELAAIVSQRILAGAVIGLVCVEYVRRRQISGIDDVR